MFCLSSANGCFKVIVSKTRTVAEWWAKLFSPSYRQWRELFCHFVTKPNLSDCIIFLCFFGNMHCLLSKNFFEPQKKNVSYESHSNSTMKSLLHVQLIDNSHFNFLLLQFTFCHLATVSCFVWETSFWKVIHLCLYFLFFFFFPKLNFSTRMMMFCHFRSFHQKDFYILMLV